MEKYLIAEISRAVNHYFKVLREISPLTNFAKSFDACMQDFITKSVSLTMYSRRVRRTLRPDKGERYADVARSFLCDRAPKKRVFLKKEGLCCLYFFDLTD